MSNFVNLLDIVYPVGSVFISNNSVSPADFIGGTYGQSSTATRLSVMERPVQLVERTKENFLSQIYHQMFGLQAVLAIILACLKLWVFCSIQATCMALKRLVLLITQIANILTSRLTIAPNIGLLTSISAQPNYILGGVA